MPIETDKEFRAGDTPSSNLIPHTCPWLQYGVDYLEAVRNGRADFERESAKARFEITLAADSSFGALSEADFRPHARAILSWTADQNDLPMDPHYRGTKRELRSGSAYLPLSKEEVRDLLQAAAASEARGDFQSTFAVLDRLDLAVEGLDISNETEGPAESRADNVARLFWEGVRNGELVDRSDEIYALLKS